MKLIKTVYEDGLILFNSSRFNSKYERKRLLFKNEWIPKQPWFLDIRVEKLYWNPDGTEKIITSIWTSWEFPMPLKPGDRGWRDNIRYIKDPRDDF